MTRKQALTLAIQGLSAYDGAEEAIQVLKTMMNELPLNRWTDSAIRDSVEQFIQDRGRVPTTTDFKKRGLPPHTVIKNMYGQNLREWLHENYPSQQLSREEISKAITECFVREYLSIKPKSASDYNAKRSPYARSWYTVAAHNDTSTWRALLKKLELPIYSNIHVPEVKREYFVRIDALLDDLPSGEKKALTEMICDGTPLLPAPNYQVAYTRDAKDPEKEHFVLRYTTDERLSHDLLKQST